MRLFTLLTISTFLLGCGSDADKSPAKNTGSEGAASGVSFTTPEEALESILALAKQGNLETLLENSTEDSKESLIELAPDGYSGKISAETLKERAIATLSHSEPISRRLVSQGREIVVFDFGPKEKMHMPTVIVAKTGEGEWKLQAWSMGRMIPVEESGLHSHDNTEGQGPSGPAVAQPEKE